MSQQLLNDTAYDELYLTAATHRHGYSPTLRTTSRISQRLLTDTAYDEPYLTAATHRHCIRRAVSHSGYSLTLRTSRISQRLLNDTAYEPYVTAATHRHCV